ncbi:hypothetical protein M0R72_15445 [Candidatus Pacearchaeota archaeon]|jgi:hypothetical protein|nr:hypothetical protein [Candidatus Pacearchaeota archaeon]
MKMTCQLAQIKLNTGAYQKALNAEMLKQLKEAVGLWIQAAITIIPVWSGASHGTFVKLASKIGQTFSLSGGGGLPGMLGPEYGNAQSRGIITAWGGAFVAEYSTTLWHLIYNEYNNANENPEEGRVYSRLIHPGPYGFQEVANAAFKAYAETVRLPSPFAYITLIPRQVS